jgi:hypothetical protein
MKLEYGGGAEDARDGAPKPSSLDHGLGESVR